MGRLRTPRPVSPIVALLSSRAEWLDAARAPLEKLLGPLWLQSEDYPFENTSYYTPTMGAGLLRRFYFFKDRADPGVLPDWKLACNRLEEELAAQFKTESAKAVSEPPLTIPERPVNIDPGYLEGSKLVLASTKDYAHRIYLRDGIFAEITLGYREEKWETYFFTFPDFKSGRYFPFLTEARLLYTATTRTRPKRRRKDRLYPE